MEFNRGCVTKRSMPFWCVQNPLGDPFGGPVLPKMDALETAKLLAEAAQKGWIEATSWHDDDLVTWDPEHPEDDLDPKSETYKRLCAIRDTLSAAGIEHNAAVCSLHGHPMFRNGGLCNPDPEIRRMARLKVERALRIGHFFGAKHYIYWVARDGFEVPVVTEWNKVYDWLAEGLNHVTDYIREKGMTNYVGATVEPKPNEPRGQMFLPTSGHAAGFIFGKLKERGFWGVNPELLQHESMALLNASVTVSYLVSMGLLKFLHFGSQIKAQFDDDFPPMTGPEGLKETVFLFHTLNKCGWKGVVEFDCHMFRCDGQPKDPVDCRRQFIEDCTRALSVAVALAERIKDPVLPLRSQAAADLDSIQQLCGLPDVKLSR